MAELRQGFGLKRLTPVVRALLIILVAVFAINALTIKLTRESGWGSQLYELFVLDPRLVLSGKRVWSVLTYALLHDLADPQHLLFNGLGLYFFAPDLEDLWGSRRFIVFSVLTALGGGLFILAAALLGIGGNPVVGASSIVMGTIVAWGFTFPDREMLFFFFLRMKGIHMVYATVAFEVLNALSFSRVSAAGHFGGMAAGALYASFRSGRIRRMLLERKLARLRAEDAALHTDRLRRREGGPSLRVIQGGAEKPPKDKRYLN